MENITPKEQPPENHVVWAILTTVMCCLPLGIVSIIKSAKVKKLWALGDTEGAQKAADDAKKYAIWSAVSFPIILVVLFVIMKYILESQVLC
jgi:hypothetical protein